MDRLVHKNKEVSKEKIIKSIVGILFIGCIIFILNKCNIFSYSSPSKIKEYLSSFGVYAPIVYIILFTFVPLTLFPDSLLALGGGLVFGTIHGLIYTLIGALCGGTLSFYIARILGKDIVDKLSKGKIENLGDKIEKKGFYIILLLRLIPLFPFDIISYSAGLSKIKFKDFMIATAVGTIPGIFVYVNIGDKSVNVNSIEFYLAIGFLVLLIGISSILKKKLQ